MVGGNSAKKRLIDENQIKEVVSEMFSKGVSLDELYREVSESCVVDLDIMAKVVQESSFIKSSDNQ